MCVDHKKLFRLATIVGEDSYSDSLKSSTNLDNDTQLYGVLINKIGKDERSVFENSMTLTTIVFKCKS